MLENADTVVTSQLSIGKYNVIGYLGAGGMAEVFKCSLKGIGGFDKTVVIKRIRSDYFGDSRFLQMFLDEARLAAMLNHPNIVQVYEADETDGLPYIAMEYADGPCLRHVIRQARERGSIRYAHMCRIIAGVALGLDHAHHATTPDGQPLGLVHRDVTPHNIIVTRDGVAKLFDFGIAKAQGRIYQTEGGGLKGKFAYVAPEQITNGDASPQSDVYSLGVTLYQCTVGRLPFDAEIEGQLLNLIIEGAFMRPTQLVPDYPPELEKTVLWAMHRDPKERCPSAEALHKALEAFIATQQASSREDLIVWLRDLFPQRTDYEELRTPPYITGSFRTPVRPTVALSPETAAEIPPAPVEEPPRKGLPRRLLVAAIAGVIVIATLVSWLLLRSGVQPPVIVTPTSVAADNTPPPPAADNPPPPATRSLASYLDEVESALRAGNHARALALLEEAAALAPGDSQQQARMRQLWERAETHALLAQAEQLKMDANWQGVADAAKRVLEIDGRNKEALAFLSEARVMLDSSRGGNKKAAAGKSSRAPSSGRVVARSDGSAMRKGLDGTAGRGPKGAEVDAADASAPPGHAPESEPSRSPEVKNQRAAPTPASTPEIRPTTPSTPSGILPREHVVRSARELTRIFKAVENECISAGIARERVENVTMPLAKDVYRRLTLDHAVTLYPRAMFQIIVASAKSGESTSTIASRLLTAYADGSLSRSSQ